MVEDNNDKENELPIASERIQKVKEVFELLEGESDGTVSLDTNNDGNIDTIGVYGIFTMNQDCFTTKRENLSPIFST